MRNPKRTVWLRKDWYFSASLLSSQVKSSHRSSSAMYLTPGGGDNDDSDSDTGCRQDDEGTFSHARL